MTAPSQVSDGLMAWLKDMMQPYGRRAILLNENGPRPGERPYATLFLTPATEVAHSEGMVDEYGDVPHTHDMRVSASFQIWGGEALSIANLLARSLSHESVRDRLRGAGVAVARLLSGVNDLSAKTGTTIEPRAQFDAEFAYAEETVDQPGWIETVRGTGTVSDSVQIDYEMGVTDA